MTRRDYVAIAAAIRPIMGQGGRTPTSVRLAVVAVTNNIADVFAADNPRFDRERFLHAALYA